MAPCFTWCCRWPPRVSRNRATRLSNHMHPRRHRNMTMLVEKPHYAYQKPVSRIAPAAPMGLPEFKTSGEIRILILDDDPQTCHLIQALLSNQGFVIDTLSDPSQVEGWL